MIGEADAILQGLDDRAPVRVRSASFVQAFADGSVEVDMSTSRFVCVLGAGFIPRAGERVQVVSVGDRHLVFPGRPLPGTGTVLTVSAGMVTVETLIGSYAMPHVGTAPTSGDLVGISWSEQPFVLGKLSVQPDTPTPPPNPGGGTVRSATFRVIDTGSTDRSRARWWQAQPWASDSTYGAWFYGTQIRDTIPAAASFVSLEFYVAWQQRFGEAPRFALHNQAVKGAMPTFQATTGWAPAAGWQTPPTAAAWFASLKAGGSALGVGLNQGGYNKFASRAENGLTGALRIYWRA